MRSFLEFLDHQVFLEKNQVPDIAFKDAEEEYLNLRIKKLKLDSLLWDEKSEKKNSNWVLPQIEEIDRELIKLQKKSKLDLKLNTNRKYHAFRQELLNNSEEEYGRDDSPKIAIPNHGRNAYFPKTTAWFPNATQFA